MRKDKLIQHHTFQPVDDRAADDRTYIKSLSESCCCRTFVEARPRNFCSQIQKLVEALLNSMISTAGIHGKCQVRLDFCGLDLLQGFHAL